jgi:hypothetical protein
MFKIKENTVIIVFVEKHADSQKRIQFQPLKRERDKRERGRDREKERTRREREREI